MEIMIAVMQTECCMGDYSRVARMITHKGGLGGGGPARGGERFTNVRSQANSNWRPKQVHNLFFYRITALLIAVDIISLSFAKMGQGLRDLPIPKQYPS